MSQQVTTRNAARHRRQAGSAGVAGNERLTAMTGALLLFGFAVEGVTVLEIHKLLVLHVIVGGLLIGPVLLKIASTGYRFIRYYTGSKPYVRKGPPAPLLRLLGPLMIITSVAVLATGIMAAVAGPRSGPWLFLHKATFVLWFGVTTIHVLNYAPRLPRLLSERWDYRNGVPVRGGPMRAPMGGPVPGGSVRGGSMGRPVPDGSTRGGPVRGGPVRGDSMRAPMGRPVPDGSVPGSPVRAPMGRPMPGRPMRGGPVPDGPIPGGPARWLGLAVSLAIGIAVAAVAMQMSSKWGISL